MTTVALATVAGCAEVTVDLPPPAAPVVVTVEVPEAPEVTVDLCEPPSP